MHVPGVAMMLSVLSICYRDVSINLPRACTHVCMHAFVPPSCAACKNDRHAWHAAHFILSVIVVWQLRAMLGMLLAGRAAPATSQRLAR